MSTLRAQFNAKGGQTHYLQWRKRVAAKLPEGGAVLLGLPGWGICTVVALINGDLIAPPRFLDAAAKSPSFAAFLRRVAEAGLISPVIYLDADDNLTFSEYSAVVYMRCCKGTRLTSDVCLFRYAGQRGLDIATRRARANPDNYLLATCKRKPDGSAVWAAAFDGGTTAVHTPANATYREVVATLFAAFPDTSHGYHHVQHAPVVA